MQLVISALVIPVVQRSRHGEDATIARYGDHAFAVGDRVELAQRAGLIDARVQSLRIQGQIISAAVAASGYTGVVLDPIGLHPDVPRMIADALRWRATTPSTMRCCASTARGARARPRRCSMSPMPSPEKMAQGRTRRASRLRSAIHDTNPWVHSP